MWDEKILDDLYADGPNDCVDEVNNPCSDSNDDFDPCMSTHIKETLFSGEFK
jgi:hypothetical protein